MFDMSLNMPLTVSVIMYWNLFYICSNLGVTRFTNENKNIKWKSFISFDILLLGMLVLTRSPENKEEGPILLADINKDSNQYDVKINGYANVMGIEAHVQIELTDTEFLFNVSGNLWGVLKAKVLLRANYGDLSSLEFQVFDILISTLSTF